MSSLPAMVYSAPTTEEAFELDFSEIKPLQQKIKKDKFKKGPVTYSKWASLPDIVLEDVFSRLSIKEKYYASQVCTNWNRIFYSSRIWKTFILEDKTLTRRKFNYYMGDQYVLDHHRTQLCLHRVARGIRRLIIKPMDNFFNLYEFMTILSYYCENYELLTLINTLDFTFGCEFSAESVQGHDKVFGTGGKLLGALKRLMEDLRGLRHLSLNDLLLEKEEAMYLLDNVAYNCCETLKTLRLVNCCKDYFPILHPVVFVNLQKLTISPQHLDDDNVSLLCNTSLRDLVLLQTKLTVNASPVSYKVWRGLLKSLPALRVHHALEGQVNKPVVWQDGAPVRSIVYRTPEIKLSIPCIFNTSNVYANTLEVLAYLDLPQYPVKDTFEDRPDTALILLARCCVYLDTLVIRDRISTATILLLVSECRNLRRLVVRQKALLLKCDWPRRIEWTDDFYDWLKKTSASVEETSREVGLMLETKWKPLTEDEFSNVRL